MKIGYVRVSTKTQNLDRQLDMLVDFGIDRRNIYEEKFTGTSLGRPVLQKMLSELQPGDIIVVTDLSRISRSRDHLMDLIELIGKKGATLYSLTDTWFRMDPNDAFYKLLLNFVLSINEFERNLLAQRTREGLAAAKERGNHPGRPKGINPEIVRKVKAIQQLMQDEHISISQACKTFGVTRSTFYRYVQQIEEGSTSPSST